MLFWAVLMMVIGYGLSCGTRWYDVPPADVERLNDAKEATNPIIPPRENFDRWQDDLTSGNWSAVLAEPPFVPPPHSRVGPDETDESFKYRKWNYWMMGQCVGAPSYQIFSAGFSLAVYVLFYILADVIGLKIGTASVGAFVLNVGLWPKADV